MIGNKLLLGSLALVALVGGLTVTAYAQSDSGEGPNWHRRGGFGAGILSGYIDHEPILADLAEALGLTPAVLEQARGGTIAVVSDPSVGTTFTVELPAQGPRISGQ